jgi:phenylalanine-4-hydroxylase
MKRFNLGDAPVTCGTGERPPRGDGARSSDTCEQDDTQSTAADHDTGRRLYARQVQPLPGLACDEFIHAAQQAFETTAPDFTPLYRPVRNTIAAQGEFAV